MKDSKRLEHNTKITNMMMLKTKSRRNKEKKPKPDTGGHDGSFCKLIPRSRNP
jgi:hypothetical protein